MESSLWFGTVEDLHGVGPPAGRGGPWVDEPVQADEPSVPLPVNGFSRRRVRMEKGRLPAD